MEKIKILEKMVKELSDLGDLEYYKHENGTLTIQINDFEGFGDEWNDIDREYTEPEKIEELENWLTENSEKTEKDYYTKYTINGITVFLGYTSYDA